MHDSSDVWDAPSVIVAGVNVQVKPVAGEIVEVSATVPVNPLTGATVIVDVAAVPALAATLVGVAATVKPVIV